MNFATPDAKYSGKFFPATSQIISSLFWREPFFFDTLIWCCERNCLLIKNKRTQPQSQNTQRYKVLTKNQLTNFSTITMIFILFYIKLYNLASKNDGSSQKMKLNPILTETPCFLLFSGWFSTIVFSWCDISHKKVKKGNTILREQMRHYFSGCCEIGERMKQHPPTSRMIKCERLLGLGNLRTRWLQSRRFR